LSEIYEQRKIICPALPPAILHREALLERLNEVISGPHEGLFPYKLVLLHAPAGYGKTTLLADFARQTNIPCCWYFLDRTDTDKITFLTYLLASIRQRFPQFGRTLDTLLTGTTATDVSEVYDWKAVEEALIHALVTEVSERFVLLLCNYHEVNESQAVNELVNFLLHKLPSQCLLVIESRAMPNLEFALLLARREMVGIGRAMLSLSTQEIRDLARVQGVAAPDDKEAEQLATSFDGWIVGILLGTRLGLGDIQVPFQFLPDLQSGGNDRWHTSGIPIQRQHLFAYVVNEVFKRDPALYAFLKDLSLLTEIPPAICAALLDITDAAERLQRLEQQGMFVTHSGEGSQIIYTCHPILRDLLYDQLRRQAPERFTMLHRRAAGLFSATHDYERAIYHALAVGADEFAAHLIIKAAEQMLNQGRLETLARWIDDLPQTTGHFPRLLLLRANLYLIEGDHRRAQPLLEEAEKVALAIVNQSSLSEQEPTLLAEIALARSLVVYRKGNYQKAQQLCQQVLSSLPADEITLHAQAHNRLGACACISGDLNSAVLYLQKALQLWGRHTINRQTAEAHFVLAASYCMLANFALAEHHILRAKACYEHLHDERGQIRTLLRLGSIKHYQEIHSEAEAAYNEVLRLASNTPRFRLVQAQALITLGILYQDQEQFKRSLAVLEEGLAIVQQMEDQYLINCALSMLATTYLYMGDTVTAALLISEIDAPPASDGQISYERAHRDLTYGLLLMYQQRYDEAYSYLTELEAILRVSGPKPEHLFATVRIAVCLVAQEKHNEAAQRLESIADALLTYDGNQSGIHTEVRHFPALMQAIQTQSEMAHLRMLLRLEQPQKTQAAAPQPQPAITPTAFSPATSAQPRLRILAFGEPSVLLQDKPVTRWRMARAMEMFFYLLDCGRPVNKEQILTVLWPEFDEQVNQTFRSTIYYLRKALGESSIVSQGSLYSLNLGDSVWYDIAIFKEQQKLATQALDSGDEAHAREALQAMIQLYRGDYVQSFYSDWCTFRRDELRRAYLDARRQLAEMAWRDEQLDESTVHWQHMLAIDNCLEEAHYGLMRCYLRQGKRGLVLRQYQRCRDILQQELAVQPGPAIQNLYQRIIAR